MNIFDDTWNEAVISHEDVMDNLSRSLSNLRLKGHSTPASYIWRYIKANRTQFESILNEDLAFSKRPLAGIVYYEIEVIDDG